MIPDDDFNSMADACITAAYHVKSCGSDEIQNIMRLLIYTLGTDIAKRNGMSDREAFTRGDKMADMMRGKRESSVGRNVGAH